METKKSLVKFRSLLRLNEKLDKAYLKGIAYGQSILITIVSNITTHEYCLFLLENSFFGVSIYKLLPIDENFQFEIQKKSTNNDIIWIFKRNNKELNITIPMNQQNYKTFLSKFESIIEEKSNKYYI